MAGLLIAGTAATALFLNSPRFGKLPSGERLERIKLSKNYRNGAFQNLSETSLFSNDKSRIRGLWEFLFTKVKDLAPQRQLPSVTTDLSALPPADDLILWMGHSSLYMQLNGERILVDPVLVSASPLSFVNKAFAGTDTYHPADIPAVDVLLITHDHWDHLDYESMLQLKDRVKKVLCPLGVGAHLEYWGFAPEIIHEMDWNDSLRTDAGVDITALPARHFSGRGLTSNKTLWNGYMLQSAFGNILLSGDTGYDSHFNAIKQKFGEIDFAIMENGQYNEDWKYIHLMPQDLVKAVQELQPKRFMTIHNSKYALGRHAWYEPLDNIDAAAAREKFELLTPKIGQAVSLRDSTQVFSKWWKEIE